MTGRDVGESRESGSMSIPSLIPPTSRWEHSLIICRSSHRAGGAVGTIQQLVQQLSLTTCTVPALALPDSSRDSDLPTSSRGAHAQPPLVTYDGACLCAARPSAAGPSAARHHLNLRLLSTHATVSFRRLMGGDGVDTESGEGDTKRLPTPHPTSLPYQPPPSHPSILAHKIYSVPLP